MGGHNFNLQQHVPAAINITHDTKVYLSTGIESDASESSRSNLTLHLVVWGWNTFENFQLIQSSLATGSLVGKHSCKQVYQTIIILQRLKTLRRLKTFINLVQVAINTHRELFSKKSWKVHGNGKDLFGDWCSFAF